MKSDKNKARKGQRRISEKSIFTYALFLRCNWCICWNAKI